MGCTESRTELYQPSRRIIVNNNNNNSDGHDQGFEHEITQKEVETLVVKQLATVANEMIAEERKATTRHRVRDSIDVAVADPRTLSRLNTAVLSNRIKHDIGLKDSQHYEITVQHKTPTTFKLSVDSIASL